MKTASQKTPASPTQTVPEPATNGVDPVHTVPGVHHVHTSPPEFASLPREQLDYIHDILRTKTYDEAQQEIWASLGCRISTNRLQRYREKIDLAAALEIVEQDTLPAVDTLHHILA